MYFCFVKPKRLPFEKRSSLTEIKKQHKDFPISADVLLMFVKEIQNFIDSAWFDPEGAITRGSFI
jgi:hypothetical protein